LNLIWRLFSNYRWL